MARAAALAIVFGAATAAADDDLAVQRDAFRRGMDRYQAGATGEAIVYWEAVYRSLGPAKGFRVAFNLARAYDALGDATHAAAWFEAFLAEAEPRRATGEALEALVVKEIDDARARLAELAAARGRVRLTAAGQVDRVDARAGQTVYVAPGAHRVVFGADDEHAVSVGAGELVEVAPRTPPARAAPNMPAAPDAPAATLPTSVAPGTDRPFPLWVVFAAGGATAAAGAVTAATYASALSKKGAYDAATDPAERQRLYGEYPASRDLAHAALGATVTLGAGTAALAAIYLLAGRERPAVGAAVAPGGAHVTIHARF